MRSWIALTIALAFFGINLLAMLWPAGWWMQAHTVRVFDGPAGVPVVMAVHREVRRKFKGRYHAVLYRETDNGWIAVSPECERVSSWIDYSPDRPLPSGDALTLAWWVGGDCSGAELPPGNYQLSTKWEIYRRIVPGPITDAILSNIFTITE